MAKTGIYAIVNQENGKRYVGSAIDIDRRWIDHRKELRRGTHHSAKLQNAWNKYGEAAFAFNVLEEVSAVEHLNQREQHWMDKFHAVADGYNIVPVAGNTRGFKHTAEAREKMAIAKRGRKLSIEHAAAIGAAHQGKKRSAEAKENMSKWQVGRKLSAETCARISEVQRGKFMAEEVRAKISASLKGRKKSPEHCENIAMGRRAMHKKPKDGHDSSQTQLN